MISIRLEHIYSHEWHYIEAGQFPEATFVTFLKREMVGRSTDTESHVGGHSCLLPPHRTLTAT